MSNNHKEKKKQHFVPQCYLESWEIPNTHQVYVYNKKSKKSYIANIENVAAERYFYDIDLTGIVSESDLKEFGFSDYDPKRIDDDQYIENYFANNIEIDFSKRLKRIIDRVKTITPWEIKNCCFISEKDKLSFSNHLALQRIRGKSVRNSIEDSNDCMLQVLEDMGASPEVIAKNTIPKHGFSYIHGKMILEKDHIKEMTLLFFSLSWLLLINKTNHPFYTCDSPIGTWAHINHPFLSMSGLNSKGVEAFFPISPNIMLVMFDGDYHSFMNGNDRRMVEVNDLENVELYNRRCALLSDMCVFSQVNDFSTIKKMLSEKPDIFNIPHTSLQWGGKTYTPRKTKQENNNA